VAVDVGVGVAVGVLVSVGVSMAVGVGVLVDVGVSVAVAVGVIQLRDRLGLLSEALGGLGVVLEVRRQHLESHVTLVSGIPGFVDRGHTTPDLLDYLVLVEDLTNKVTH
jgi:hypothetical protein